MGKIDFQLHATRDEMVSLIREIVHDNSLKVVSIVLFPEFECKMLDDLNDSEACEMILDSKCTILFNYSPNLSVQEYHEFINSNVDGLMFEIGKETTEELGISRISTITKENETLKLWRLIVRRFKKTLMKGAWVVNNENGSKEYYKNHLYTCKAKELNEIGVRATPSVGWTEYVLNNESDAPDLN